MTRRPAQITLIFVGLAVFLTVVLFLTLLRDKDAGRAPLSVGNSAQIPASGDPKKY
jgi:hypothetical protein